MALASETSTLDGFAPTTAILDEWHEAKTRKTYNVIKSGMTQQKNGLLCVISTAGLDLNVPMYEEYLLLDRVLKRRRTSRQVLYSDMGIGRSRRNSRSREMDQSQSDF